MYKERMTTEFHYSPLKEDHWVAVVEMNKNHSIIINNNTCRHRQAWETAKRAFHYSMITTNGGTTRSLLLPRHPR